MTELPDETIGEMRDSEEDIERVRENTRAEADDLRLLAEQAEEFAYLLDDLADDTRTFREVVEQIEECTSGDRNMLDEYNVMPLNAADMSGDTDE